MGVGVLMIDSVFSGCSDYQMDLMARQGEALPLKVKALEMVEKLILPLTLLKATDEY